MSLPRDEMHEDAPVPADVDLSGSHQVVLGGPSGIVRIGVRSTTGRREDKIVRLSINIPNSTRNISVEVPLQKILEDDDDNDDKDDINRYLTFNATPEGEVCSRCQMIRHDEPSKMMTYEIKTSLRQLLLSKLLERLAKKTLFRNYEQLIAKEIGEKTEVNKNLSITYNSSENRMHSSSMEGITDRQLSQVRSLEDSSKVRTIKLNCQSSVNDIVVKDFIQSELDEFSENVPTSETMSPVFVRQTLRHFSDVATETVKMTEKVDKSTTIHKDESTQTGQQFDISSDPMNFMPSLESKHRIKQPSSVSSSCQTDVEEIVSLEALSSRAESDDSKVEVKRDVVPGKASNSSRETFERINGDLEEEYEREDDIRTPQPRESKSSYVHDDSATETESVTSSIMSSVSDKSKKYEIQTKIDYKNKGSKTATSTKTESHSSKSNEKSSLSDNYLKNLKGKTTSSEQVAGKEKIGEFGIRRQSKDNQSFTSTSPASKVEQAPKENVQQQKQSTQARPFSSKPVQLETNRFFDVGIDYTKNPPDVGSGSNTSSQSRNSQQPATNASSNQASKQPQQSKSTRNNQDKEPESLRSGSVATSNRSEDTAQTSISSKSSAIDKSVKTTPSTNPPKDNHNPNPVPEVKERGRFPSSFKHLVSAFETKISEDQHKKTPYKYNPLK